MLVSELIGITDLVAVNLQCFGLIILGYISRRFNLIGPEEAKGLNIFVSYFSLPAMIFQSLATMPLSNIDFNFVGSILISKSIIFLVVLLVTFVLSCKSCSKQYTTRRSAIYAIFCTQSNDFALGYPLLLSLYGNTKTSLANYLYILAPIQLLLLNPIALLLIEVSKNLQQNESSRVSRWHRVIAIVKIIFQKIFINPIILATFLGIVVNLANDGSLPQVTVSFFQVLAQSFSSVALFLLGLNLYGNFQLLKNFSQPLLITLLLVTLKIFCMPLLNRFFVQHIRIFPSQSQNASLTEFAFLYGTFPAAPTVYIFSNIYDIETVIISTGLVISTIFSAPLMFVSANMIRLSSFIDYKLLEEDLLQTIFFTSVVSIVGSLLLVSSFFNGYKLRSLTHRYSFKILASHFLVLLGGFLYKLNILNVKSHPMDDKLSIAQYLLFQTGLFSLKIWTSFLSLTLVLLYAKSLCYTVRMTTRLLIIGLGLILSYFVFMVITYDDFPLQPSPSLLDLYYGNSKVHLFMSMFTSCLSILTLIVSLVMVHYYKNVNTYQSLEEIPEDSTVEESGPSTSSTSSENYSPPPEAMAELRSQRPTGGSNVIEVEDLFLALPRSRMGEDFNDTCNDVCHSHCSASKSCGDRLRQYKINIENAIEAVDLTPSLLHEELRKTDFHQVYHHMYLLLFLALSTVVHLVVEVYHFIQDESTAISVEIEFLDILLTFSQGFIMFIIFGFDMDMLIYKFSKLFTLSLRLNQIYLPPVSSLDAETVAVSSLFRDRHLTACVEVIGFHLNNQSVNHSNQRVFSGRQLIDWLLRKRLVVSRKEGLDFGRHLLYGRVLEHITREHFFYDNTFYYRFL